MKLLRLLTLIAGLGAVTLPSSAQQTGANQPESFRDPIVDMLDSLVTITHVVRYNQLDANCYDSNSPGCVKGPVFSDQVYTERINALKSPIPLSYNKYVKEYIDLYANRKRGLTQRVMGLSNLYFPLFEETLDRENLPLEFKYLSIVESALNPVAVSRVGATGLWQFMYNTGILYNLKVNSYTDDRRDPVKATQAACQYFKDMYRIYGDWLLVIASYNCGPGNVNRAIKRSGGKTNFWEIMPYLPAETRGYVPAFIAVTYVMNYAREHQLNPVTPAYAYFEVDTVTVDRAVNFNVLSKEIGLPTDVISYLNPIYKRGAIPDVGSGYTLRLPTGKMAQFLKRQEDIFTASAPAPRPVMPVYTDSNEEETLASGDGSVRYETVSKQVKKSYTVRRGDNLAKIAGKYDMSVAELKKLNRLRSTALKAGQRLTVTAWVTTKVAIKEPAPNIAKAGDTLSSPAVVSTGTEAGKDSGLVQQTPEPSGTAAAGNASRFEYHVVQPGDTLWNIARRYSGTTVELLKDMNNIQQDATLTPGTKLKVIVNG